MSDRPPVDYDLAPRTFNDLLASALGQRHRDRTLGNLRYDEKVIITASAMIDLFEIVADLRARVAILEAGPNPSASTKGAM